MGRRVLKALASLFALAALSACSASMAGADSASISSGVEAKRNSNLLRVVRGRYDYLSLSDRQLRGTESFLLLAYRDGTRTLNAYSDIFSRDVHVNTSIRVDARFRPIEAFMQTYTQGRLKGSALFRREEDGLREVITGPSGVIDRTIEAPDEFSIAVHPIATDSWQFWKLFGETRSPVTTTIYNIDGSPKFDEPMIGTFQTYELRHLGERTVTTAAGQFETRGYALGDLAEAWIAGEDNLIVELTWPRFDRIYVLTEYSVSGRI